jgi:ABC-2 type transport system ATP-binding protein
MLQQLQSESCVSVPAFVTRNSFPPLRVEGLVKHFGAARAIDGITLELCDGECLGLLGPNGAGKTTLIRSIVGRVIADAGTVTVFGAPADSKEARSALGWIPQELALYPKLSCRENLQAFGRYNGLKGAALERAVERSLAWTNLGDRSEDLAENLSGGMKRRLNMGAGLIHQPKVVLMDEPTVGIDPQSRIHIFEMIAKLRDEGMSIIYTTHYMEEAERLCDRIAIVDHGKIIAQGSHPQLVNAAFGSRSEVLARFAGINDRVLTWVKERGGGMVDGVAQFQVDGPNEIVNLFEASARSGLQMVDVSLRKPNLESVFLQLTGRELRD